MTAGESPRPRVSLVADWDRADVADVRDAVERIVATHAEITSRIDANDADAVPSGDTDFAVVIGGDGTIIRHLRRLGPAGIPIAGVNVGRLGFLAEFDTERLEACASDLFAGRLPVLEHRFAGWRLTAADGRLVAEGLAVNDCAIASGPPFRMIELDLEIDGAGGPRLAGDGLVIATPTGSTAYSASAGGPIVHPSVQALVLTPLAAHSLAFRPIVLGGSTEVRVRVRRANAGTSFVRDGEVIHALAAGDLVAIRPGAASGHMIADPGASYWAILQDKLNWALPPRYRR